MLEDQQAQHHRRRRPQAAAPPTLRVTARQGIGDALDEHLIVEQRIDPAERGVPELVRIGQEHFDQAALRVRPPHHGTSGEAGWPHGFHLLAGSPPCEAGRGQAARSGQGEGQRARWVELQTTLGASGFGPDGISGRQSTILPAASG